MIALSDIKREAQPTVLDMIKHDCSSVLNDFKYAALHVMLKRMQHWMHKQRMHKGCTHSLMGLFESATSRCNNNNNKTSRSIIDLVIIENIHIENAFY